MFDKLQLITGVAGGQNPLRHSRQKRRCHPGSFCFLTSVPHSLSAFDFYLLQSSSLCCSVFPLHLHSVPAAFFVSMNYRGTLNGLQGHQDDFHLPPGREMDPTICTCLFLLKLFQGFSPVHVNGASHFGHSHSTCRIYPTAVYLFYGLPDILL